jgi:hypothetical protein
MLDPNRDIEGLPISRHDSDDSPILAPQLNVGGHGATQRRLKNYHVTMIGFCSGIGTGLFIGTGAAYANAGPAGLLLAYIIVGSVLWCVMQSIAELATVVRVISPISRGIAHQCSRFPRRARFRISPAASSIQQSGFLWPSVTDTVTLYPSPRNAQRLQFLSVTGPTSRLRSLLRLVWCSFLVLIY